MALAQAIQMTDKIRNCLPQTVFDDRETPFGFVDSGRTLLANFVGAPDLFYQTVQASTHFIALKGQQVTALAVGEGFNYLVVFADQRATGNFGGVRSKY